MKAAEIVAASSDRVDVAAAIALADNDDTIVMPVGKGSFASTLRVTKRVNFRGFGNLQSNEVTTIRNIGSGNRPIFSFVLSSDGPIRISGINFDCNGHSGVFFDNQHTLGEPMTNVRVDHCSFNNAGSISGTSYHGLKFSGHVYGVVDHNLFYDCVIPFEFDDDDSAAWNRSPYPGAGTTNSVVFEDNVVDGTNVMDMAFYLSNGARFTARYNAFTNRFSPQRAIVVDAHGNNEAVTENGLRGTIFLQYYKNMTVGRANFALRGGHQLVFSNHFVNQPYPALIIGMTEEEFCRPDIYGGMRSPYPAGDMITNAFFWANYGNGEAITPLLYCEDPGSEMLKENRDFFLRAPQSGDSENVFPLPLLAYPHPRVTAEDCATLCDSVEGTQDGSQPDSLFNYQAVQFTAEESASICMAKLYLSKTGNPTYPVFASIYSNAIEPDRPGTLISDSQPVNSSSLTINESSVQFTGLKAALTKGTKYWIMYQAQANAGTDRTQWHYDDLGTGTRGALLSDSNGSTWVLLGDTLKYKFALYSHSAAWR